MVATMITGSETDGDKWVAAQIPLDGKVVTKTMLTLQMAKMIEEGTLRPSAEISRTPRTASSPWPPTRSFSPSPSAALPGRPWTASITENKKLYDQIVKE